MEHYKNLVSNGCAICKGPPRGKGRYAFDHDHETDKFRGLLCTPCNMALGCFYDDENRLRIAIEYLKNNESHTVIVD